MRRHLPLCLIALIAPAAATPDARFDARSGYRIADYRGVVPAPPPGVARIDAATVAALVDAGRATLIDVVPAEGAVRTADGHWRLAREQRSIAGAAWFPEAGRGAIDPAVERWFLRGGARLHAAAPRATLIVFCLADCWMSWNAAWRLRRAGYRRVRWFAEGVDGWRDLGRPLVPITPYPEPL
ncbi:rhodanese [Sphingomonas melonis]|jgi:PQQ-dependent catabolism-associated CXXCW motif protein|uniref:rhodanese-like domain-containing protein n=1 Tax=Sphingomonas melonis TaxID=152682 RepID=UPI001C8B24DB|nr:rhodanese-like domain-containing protein [Sphingomonas melonis]MBX8843320.1 rhodanese [Sphingomonas melonis]MBX8853236.1 rhodanese [Sphingomonas melonis]MBX8897895.1 rhodanese [Sphingomonas melonis]